MKKLFSFVALALLALSSPARADPIDYSFDTVHSQIIFFISHLGFSISEGEFQEWDGMITFDETAPQNAKVDVTIHTDSLDMDDETWDEHVKAEKYFNVAQYPAMTFKSTAIEVTGEKTGKMTGDLTLLGVTKPVTLDVTFHKAGKHPMSGKQTAGFSATGTLNRSEFGMTEGLPYVGDEVEIRIEVEANALNGAVTNE